MTPPLTGGEPIKNGSACSFISVWLEMTDMRNLTSHTYNEAVADKIYDKLADYLKSFEKLEKILEKTKNL